MKLGGPCSRPNPHLKLEKQIGFRKARSCSDGCFTLKIFIGKHPEFNIQKHIVFVEFMKLRVHWKAYGVAVLLSEKIWPR